MGRTARERVALMLRMRLALAAAIVAGMMVSGSEGGWRQRRVTVGRPGGLAMTNVPAWAAERMSRTPGPVLVPRNSRRPWVSALANADTPAARMARYYELGGGAGPVPGYTNEPFNYVPYSTFDYPNP